MLESLSLPQGPVPGGFRRLGAHRPLAHAALGLAMSVAVAGPARAATPEGASPPTADTVVVLETSRGDIVIQLDVEKAPVTTANFLALVRTGFYDEIVFHRIIRDKVIQAGMLDMEGQLRGLDVEPIENEAPNRVHNGRGTIAMARTEDPQSATTQFFINVRDNWEYNFSSFARDEYGYAVFGTVIEGMDIVDEISRIATKRVGQLRDFPQEIVAIYRAYALEEQ